MIIPSYRPGVYLKECLDSVCSQSLNIERFEIIIILNGCNEPYKQEIERYIRYHQGISIKLIQTDVPGVSNARNLGIEAAQSDYITFVDDDDIISPTYIEGLLEVSSPRCIGCSNSYAFKGERGKIQTNFISKAYERCKKKKFSLFEYRQFLSPPVAKLIHREVIGESRFPLNLKKSEDSVFCFLLSPRVREMKLAKDTVIYYQRLREGSTMRTKNSFFREVVHLCKLEKAYLKIWLMHPFLYNFRFFLSRVIAGVVNFAYYIK